MNPSEQELAALRAQLAERYCLAGKALLELAEREGREIGRLVDQIVACEQALKEIYDKENNL